MKVEGKLSGRTKETTRGEGEGKIAGYGGRGEGWYTLKELPSLAHTKGCYVIKSNKIQKLTNKAEHFLLSWLVIAAPAFGPPGPLRTPLESIPAEKLLQGPPGERV